MKEEQINRSIITAWRYRENRSAVDALAAVEGAAMLRDEGSTWLEKGQGYTLKVLYNTGTLADQGDGKAARPLWAVAQERYRRDDDPKPDKRRRGGMDTIGDVLAGISRP